MFTGLIQKKGSLSSLLRDTGGWRLRIKCTPWENDPLIIGESVAVQGVCLTVVAIEADGFTADLLDETLRRSTLGQLRDGAALNLERALKLGDRLGGHIVSGHIDETGTLLSITDVGRDYELTVSCSRDFASQCVMKGSIAVNGVSLTITALTDTSVSVDIIPHTWKETSLSQLKPDSPINLEADVIGKFVSRRLATISNGIDESTLERAGFLDE